LLLVAQGDGDFDEVFSVGDIYLLFSTAPTDQPPAARARWLDLVLTGLTTHTRTGDTGSAS
ncbi:TetR/AcrR family transcriptional regulator, partial [Streptomyces sp. NPDC057253]